MNNASISSLAAAAALFALAGSAIAADMPVKAAPAPVVVAPYDWSGVYVGFHEGYEWASVQDTTPAFTQTESTVKNWIVGFHGGIQKQFGVGPWGTSWLLGVEASLNEPVKQNNLGNLTSCANPAFACGLTNLKDMWTGGVRGGLASNNWLFTISGGYATAVFQRADVLLATGAVNVGGGQSVARHDGSYIGAGLEYLVYHGSIADWIGGIDYQHVWLNSQGDRDANGVVHTMGADVDIIRFRTTLKFNPF